MEKNTAGLLPLYLELYDKVRPDNRKEIESFLKKIKEELEKSGIEIIPAPVCRVKNEFAKAVKEFEMKSVDAIVTLHLAYSPSLEAADILAKTSLPLILLDTTPDFDFGFGTDPSKIMTNHGIHGVQDLCNMLIRKGKPFIIEAGHWQKSDILKRVTDDLNICIAANAMKTSRVGIIGKPFKGMGDFSIPFSDLKKQIGFDVIQARETAFTAAKIEDLEIKREIAVYKKSFKTGKFSEKCIEETARTSLIVRKWMEKEKLSAFTFNFLDINKKCGLPTVPFLEASQAMSRGIGYAGEGDVLTAAFVASLMRIFPETSFAEMFCPDWKGNRIFLSHMGEANTAIIEGKAELLEKDFPFIKSRIAPALAQGCMKEGKAALVNLAPGPDGKFKVIVCKGQMRSSLKSKMSGIRGWFEPEIPVDELLAKYSRNGGTHHLALVYEADIELIEKYAMLINWDMISI